MKRARLTIKGRVQGVFFRRSAQEEANRLGISGWVRNLADGSVEAFAQGEDALVERFLSWCRHGPPGARVDSVTIDIRPENELSLDEVIEMESRFIITGSW